MKKIVASLKKIVPFLLNRAPIRKVLVAAVASAVVFLARLLHISVGSEEATNAVSAAVPVFLAYWTPDPRVHEQPSL